jgi:hypothetical protein
MTTPSFSAEKKVDPTLAKTTRRDAFNQGMKALEKKDWVTAVEKFEYAASLNQYVTDKSAIPYEDQLWLRLGDAYAGSAEEYDNCDDARSAVDAYVKGWPWEYPPDDDYKSRKKKAEKLVKSLKNKYPKSKPKRVSAEEAAAQAAAATALTEAPSAPTPAAEVTKTSVPETPAPAVVEEKEEAYVPPPPTIEEKKSTPSSSYSYHSSWSFSNLFRGMFGMFGGFSSYENYFSIGGGPDTFNVRDIKLWKNTEDKLPEIPIANYTNTLPGNVFYFQFIGDDASGGDNNDIYFMFSVYTKDMNTKYYSASGYDHYIKNIWMTGFQFMYETCVPSKMNGFLFGVGYGINFAGADCVKKGTYYTLDYGAPWAFFMNVPLEVGFRLTPNLGLPVSISWETRLKYYVTMFYFGRPGTSLSTNFTVNFEL